MAHEPGSWGDCVTGRGMLEPRKTQNTRNGMDLICDDETFAIREA